MPRRSEKSLLKKFDDCEDGVYFVSPQGNILYANQRLADWLGCARDELLGACCQFATVPEADDPAARFSELAVPPEADGDLPFSTRITVHQVGDAVNSAPATYIPVHTQPRNLGGWLVFVGLRAAKSEATRLPNQQRKGTEPIRWTPAEIRAAVSERRASIAREGSQIEFDVVPGVSPDADRIRRAAHWVIASRADVLIWGPAGSGRQYLARTIAGNGKPPSHGGPVLIDCRLIDAETLQRTLTATCKQLPAEERDVLLRGVEHLSAECAAELRGFLQLPNHGLRVLATAQRPLVELAAKNAFDAVLSARLSGLVIEIPPLSQRREDIPVLAQILLESFARLSRTSVRSLAPPVLKQLAEYHWPGEIAELRDVVRQSAERCVQSQILVADLPDRFRLAHAASCTPRYAGQELVLDEYLADIERRLLERALHQSKWNKAQAARCLSISRARLIRRAEQLGIQFPTPDIPFEEIDDEPS